MFRWWYFEIFKWQSGGFATYWSDRSWIPALEKRKTIKNYNGHLLNVFAIKIIKKI